MEISQANEDEVRKFFNVLSDAATDYLNANNVEPVDAFMAAHNIHVWLLINIEKSLGADYRVKLDIRKMAIDTFALSLERRE